MIFRGVAGLMLFFPAAAFASSVEPPSMTSYLVKVGLSLGLLAIAGYLAVFFSGKKTPLRMKGAVVVLASLSLGKDVLFVVRCGPDVIALLSGKNGGRVIGRWRFDEWQVGSNETPDP